MDWADWAMQSGTPSAAAAAATALALSTPFKRKTKVRSPHVCQRTRVGKYKKCNLGPPSPRSNHYMSKSVWHDSPHSAISLTASRRLKVRHYNNSAMLPLRFQGPLPDRAVLVSLSHPPKYSVQTSRSVKEKLRTSELICPG